MIEMIDQIIDLIDIHDLYALYNEANNYELIIEETLFFLILSDNLIHMLSYMQEIIKEEPEELIKAIELMEAYENGMEMGTEN